jgi:hypothetical protein
MSQHMQMGISQNICAQGAQVSYSCHDTYVHFAFHIFMSSHLFMRKETEVNQRNNDYIQIFYLYSIIYNTLRNYQSSDVDSMKINNVLK